MELKTHSKCRICPIFSNWRTNLQGLKKKNEYKYKMTISYMGFEIQQKCACTKQRCSTNRCQCRKAGLNCSDLFTCSDEEACDDACSDDHHLKTDDDEDDDDDEDGDCDLPQYVTVSSQMNLTYSFLSKI